MTDQVAQGQTAPETRTLVERLARYLATRDLDAANPSDAWADHIEAAASLLAVIKDPDAEMEQAGDGATWRRMIDAALVSRWSLQSSLSGEQGEAPGGSDEEGDVPFSENAPGVEKSPSWIQHGSAAS
ncbi:MAG: hypothetical protein ACSLE1_01130 [Sphingobium sp.]